MYKRNCPTHIVNGLIQIAQNGRYAHLYHAQAQYYQEK